MISFVVTAAAATRCGRTATELLPAGAPVPTRVTSPTPHTFVPAALDWRAVNGTAFTTRVGYQLIPSPCGSCWAFAATGALSDRIKIATGGLMPDVTLSPQALLDCGASATPSTGSCNGGNPTLAYEFMANTGITDETCSPYQGVDNTNWAEVPCKDRMCRRCDRFGTCRFLPANESMVIKVQEHGTVKGVDAMKAEIAARGPIACLMYAHADAFEAYTGGIISDTTRYSGITHVVTVTGWGVDAASKKSYWVVRNSFGTGWGELGYYRQEIGLDVYNMESHDCSWATPTAASLAEIKRRSAL